MTDVHRRAYISHPTGHDRVTLTARGRVENEIRIGRALLLRVARARGARASAAS